jgi:hypothetical protein
MHNLVSNFHRNEGMITEEDQEAQKDEKNDNEKQRRKERRQRQLEQQEEHGTTTLDKESNISIDISKFTSNMDISFHQLTEQYDSNSAISLLLNTLQISSDLLLKIEKDKINEIIQEEIDTDSEDEKINTKTTKTTKKSKDNSVAVDGNLTLCFTF